MKRLFKIAFIVFATAVSLASCSGGKGGSNHYRVFCHLAKNLDCDSATLYVVSEDYTRRMLVGGCRQLDGEFAFEGQVADKCVGYLTFYPDTVPFYFIVEPGTIDISIGRDWWTIADSRANSEYIAALNSRQIIVSKKRRVRDDYERHIADSTLTIELESAAVARDKQLSDSLAGWLADRITVGDPIAHILADRFGGQVDPKPSKP